jgi:thioredoxin reductase (NADPH)
MASEDQKEGGAEEVYDVVIIGGGPAGLTAAMYAARANLNVIVIDKNPVSGALGSTEKIENYPGLQEPVGGKDLVETFAKQARSFGAKIVQAQVMLVDFDADPKQVMAGTGTYLGKAVIIATGSMGRKPTIKNEVEMIGRGVSYCVTCDAAFYKEKDAVITGDVEEVLEEIDILTRFAKKVYLITPAKELTHEQKEGLKGKPKIEVLLRTRVVEVLGKPTVKSVKVSGPEGKGREIPVSGIFILLHGSTPVTDYLHEALAVTEDGSIKVDKEDMSTSVPGVFAAGDVCSKRYRQVVIAAADGAIAALSADKYINKREKPRYQWHQKE